MHEAGASALPQKREWFIFHLGIGLTVRMRESSVTTLDRRQSPRTKLVEIAYIGMGPENGGLVLDVSDGGLSFHSVAPVRQAETIDFLLSSRGHNRIEGSGEVVWTNDMKTVCGLRFTSLSAGAREYLYNWTNQSRMAVAARKQGVSPAPPANPHQKSRPPHLRGDLTRRRNQPLPLLPPMNRIFQNQQPGPCGGSQSFFGSCSVF